MALPPGLRKRGRMFYVQYRDDSGNWKSTSVGPDLEMALRRHTELRDGQGRSLGPTLADVIPSWLDGQETRCKPKSVTVSRQRSRLLLRHLGDLRIEELTSDRVDELVRIRRAEGVKDISINGDLTTLRQIVNYAENVKLIERAPRIKMLRVVRKGRRRTYKSAEISALLKAADERPGAPHVALKLHAFILIGATTGMRYEEILHLQWRDIDFDDCRFDVRSKSWIQFRNRERRELTWSPKSHQERTVWAESDALFTFLKDYRETLERNGGIDWVFQGRRPGDRLTTLTRSLRETFKWAGVYEYGKLAHTLRHSVATELLAGGVDLETVRDVMGHRDVTTTALYLHSTDERKKKAASRLKLV